MNVRFCTLLFIAGLTACSKSQDAAVNDPNDVDQRAQVAPDAAAKPNAMETTKPVRATTPTNDERPTRTTAPLVADYKGNNPNAVQPATYPQETKPLQPGVAPDNTKVNERDRSAANPTPLDQGNNETDLKITQQIRQAVMADGALSFTAKNVKIITQNGKVTLRGPVNSEDERSRIETAARKVAGTAQVDNQLEVKK